MMCNTFIIYFSTKFGGYHGMSLSFELSRSRRTSFEDQELFVGGFFKDGRLKVLNFLWRPSWIPIDCDVNTCPFASGYFAVWIDSHKNVLLNLIQIEFQIVSILTFLMSVSSSCWLKGFDTFSTLILCLQKAYSRYLGKDITLFKVHFLHIFLRVYIL